jgi:light-regulated signal transduction histidine kinase (bacteriophytochrome)
VIEFGLQFGNNGCTILTLGLRRQARLDSSGMKQGTKLRQTLPVVVMSFAGLVCIVGLLPAVFGERPAGIVYAMMGSVVALLTVKIADRHRAQRELMDLNEELDRRVKERTAQLDAANKELEAFSYSVAHDLRGPLQQLSGFVELLQQREAEFLHEEGTRYLEHINRSVWGMSHLIDDLLDFSRAERVDLKKKVVSLEELINEVRHNLRHLTDGREIVWKVGSLPPVYADRAILRVAIVNLLSNALKFSRGRQPAVIEIGAEVQDRAVVAYVRDNGVGFDMQRADKLFGVFQRLHPKHEFEGNGIGLANVQRMIQRHGGHVWAESCVGGGATFWFSLPRNLQMESQEQPRILLEDQDLPKPELQASSDNL